LDERFGSGDSERKTLLTRQIASEPLPTSVLFRIVCSMDVIVMMIVWKAAGSFAAANSTQ